MWYIGAVAARASASATSATVESLSTERDRGRSAANTPVAPAPTGPSSSSTISSTVISVAGAGERVAALDAALRAQDAGPAQRREQLLEELHGDLAPARELGDRHRAAIAVSGAARRAR